MADSWHIFQWAHLALSPKEKSEYSEKKIYNDLLIYRVTPKTIEISMYSLTGILGRRCRFLLSLKVDSYLFLK